MEIISAERSDQPLSCKMGCVWNILTQYYCFISIISFSTWKLVQFFSHTKKAFIQEGIYQT